MKRLRSGLNRLAGFVALTLAGTIPVPAQTSITFSPVDKQTVLTRFQDVPTKNTDRQQRIKALFAEVGCGDLITEQKLKHSDYANVICRLPGETDETIIVGAHFDKVVNGMGAIDNWSGASLLASLYQSLVGTKRRHTFLFISFCEEEQGLIGSVLTFT